MKTRLLTILLCVLSMTAFTQTPDSVINNNYLKVYLDGVYGYQEFIKTEIPYVNYVRDRFEAEVHLLITQQGTGSGGRDYTLYYLGQNSMAGHNDTLHYIANTNNTSDETRNGLVQIMKMGLMPYIAKLDGDIPVTISYNKTTSTNEEKETDDKWHNWVYSLSSYANINLSSTYKSYSMSGDVAADKVTDEWKININAGAYGNADQFIFDDGSTYESNNNGSYGNFTVVNSIGDHWSVGGLIDYSSSTYSNYDLHVTLSPAVEYDIFPYDESTTKLFSIFYQIGPDYSNYTDTTIFDKTEEILLHERLDVSLSLTQKWGSVTLGLNGSNYFHDLSKYAAGCFTSLNWRIYEGLSLNGYFNFNLIQDQLNLPKGDLSDEEVLLQIHEQKTSYNFYSFFGISYTFGSIYNNVVNPRFEGGNHSFSF